MRDLENEGERETEGDREWETEIRREREWKRNETLRDSVRENERDSVNIFNFEIMIFNIIK